MGGGSSPLRAAASRPVFQGFFVLLAAYFCHRRYFTLVMGGRRGAERLGLGWAGIRGRY